MKHFTSRVAKTRHGTANTWNSCTKSEATNSIDKKEFIKVVGEYAMLLALELFYSLSVTYFVGKWAIAYAYAERGYKAYGCEYLLIALTFVGSFYTISKFFKNFRR